MVQLPTTGTWPSGQTQTPPCMYYNCVDTNQLNNPMHSCVTTYRPRASPLYCVPGRNVHVECAGYDYVLVWTPPMHAFDTPFYSPATWGIIIEIEACIPCIFHSVSYLLQAVLVLGSAMQFGTQIFCVFPVNICMRTALQTREPFHQENTRWVQQGVSKMTPCLHYESWVYKQSKQLLFISCIYHAV